MATYETVVRLQLDNRDAVERLGRMEAELQAVRKRTSELNKEVRENGTVTKEQALELGTLRSQAKNLSGQIRELSNETSGLSDAGLRFRDKMAGATLEAIKQTGVLGQLDARAEDLSASLNRLEREYKEGRITQEQYTASQNRLQAELGEARAKAQALQVQIDRLDREYREGLLSANQYRAAIDRLNVEMQEQAAITRGAFSGAIRGGIADLKSFALSSFGVIAAIEGIRRALVDSFQKYAEQERVIRQLQFAAKDSAAALMEQARALQQVTTVGDEAIMAQQAFLASIGFTEQQIKDIIPAALDLAAATGRTLEFAVLNLSKTYGGLTGELGEVIPELKNFTAEELKAGAAVEYATKQFAGQAELLATTGAGAVQQMNNALGDLQETIGGAVSPLVVALSKHLKTLFEDIEAGTRTTATFTERLRGFFSAVPGLVPMLIRALGDTASETERMAEMSRLLAKDFDNVAASSEDLAKRLEFLKERQESYRKLGTQPGVVAAHQRQIDEVEEIIAKRKALDEVLFQQTKTTEADTDATVENTEAAVESTDATSKQAAAVRILTDELRAYLKAVQDINQGIGIGQMDTATPEAGPGALSPLGPGVTIDQINMEADAYAMARMRMADADVQAADASIAAYAQLSQAIGQSLAKGLEDVEDAGQAFLLVTLETVTSAVRLWLAATFAQEVGTKSFAGIATFAALSILVEAALASARNSIQGFATGGVIQGGQPIRRANGDNVLITAKVGEVIMNEEQQRRLVAMLGPGAFKALGIPGFATGGRLSKGTALVNAAAPRPSSSEMVNARLAGLTEAAMGSPIFASIVEIENVQGRRMRIADTTSL